MDEDGLPSLLSSSYEYEQKVEINESLELDIQSVKRQEVIMRVNRNQLKKDQDVTGLKLWEFGLEFAKWLSSKPNFFSNKRILELGAGCGTLSISLAATASEALSITMTDAAEEALGLLQLNLEKNQHKLVAPVTIKKCLWTVEPDDSSLSSCADIVLGTDLLYHMTTVESLFATAIRALEKKEVDDKCSNDNSGVHGVFFLGGMSRYYGTIESIRNTASSLQLACHFVSLKEMNIHYCDGMFLAIISTNESNIEKVIQELELTIDAGVNDDHEEDNDDY
jgi:predicted nicotinamide N-methyase